MLLRQLADLALVLALLNAGNSSAARMAMMAITTSNSIRVKAKARDMRDFVVFIAFMVSPQSASHKVPTPPSPAGRNRAGGPTPNW